MALCMRTNTQCSSESKAGVQIKDLNLDRHDERGDHKFRWRLEADDGRRRAEDAMAASNDSFRKR